MSFGALRVGNALASSILETIHHVDSPKSITEKEICDY